MGFDASKYDNSDLRTAFKIFDELLTDLEQARIDTARHNKGMSPDDAHKLVTEISVCQILRDTIKEEFDIKQSELDTSDEET